VPALAFAGTIETHTNAVRGSSARIEYFNEALCSGLAAGFGTYSAYWVAVVGQPTAGRNIYQLGVDKCQGTACPASNPVKTPYYFWAYGRDPGGPCGNAVDPVPVKASLQPPSSGTVLYSIFRQFVSGQGNFYLAKISGQTQVQIDAASLETCWGGVDEAQLLNETLDQGDQSGGIVANAQNWESPLWHNGSAWVPITRPGFATCEAHDRPTMQCRWDAAGAGQNFWSWDTRY
jgi:hypothetical protein